MGRKLLRYWKIVAGHKEKTPDEVKSVMLGDWLRNNYIAIGWGEENSQHRVFRDDMNIGDKVVVVTDGLIWALGEITGDFESLTLPKESALYEHRRNVFWYKITKLSYRNIPKALKNKLSGSRAINELNCDQWESLIIYSS